MSKKVTSVTLIFENCDSAEIDITHFHQIGMASQYTSYNIDKNIMREFVVVEATLIFNKGFENITYSNKNFDIVDANLFKRLKVRDITQIELQYDDNTTELFLPVWGGYIYAFNECQDVFVMDEKLYIAFHNKKTLGHEFYNFKRKFKNFCWKMTDIGRWKSKIIQKYRDVKFRITGKYV